MKHLYDFCINHLLPLVAKFIEEKVIFYIMVIVFLGIINKTLSFFDFLRSRIKRTILNFMNIREVFLFGRTNVEEDIYNYHKKGRNNKCILICGNGGTGKTTIAKYMKAYPRLGPQILVVDNGVLPTASALKKNTIVFFDYIYEHKTEIVKLYNSLKKKSHITLVLLEREFNSDNLRTEIPITRVIDLNEDINKLKVDDMKDVIYNNIIYDFNKDKNYYRRNTESFNIEKAGQYAEYIEKRFDSNYFRPIFAIIISKIHKKDHNFQIENLKNVDDLYNQYWEMILGQEKLIKSFKNISEDEQSTINNLIADVKLLIIFVALSGLRISFDFFENKVNNIVIHENNKVFESDQLQKYIEDKMKLLTKGNFVFFLQQNIKKYEGKYFIEKNDYDLSIGWLFKDSLVNSKLKEEIFKMISIINDIKNSKYVLTSMYSFLSRIGDENEEYFESITKLLKDVKENNINLYGKIEIYISFICNSKKLQRQFHLEKLKSLWKIIEDEEYESKNAYEKFALDVIDRQGYHDEITEEIKSIVGSNSLSITKTI